MQKSQFMGNTENIFSDNRGNQLMVALYFYDKYEKINTLKIPEEYADIEIADISIEKIELDKPLHYGAFAAMNRWLFEQFELHPNAIFSFICSLDALDTNHQNMPPEQYRWRLFDALYNRFIKYNQYANIHTQDVIFGPDDYLAYTRTFYRSQHAPIIYIVGSYLKDKYNQTGY